MEPNVNKPVADALTRRSATMAGSVSNSVTAIVVKETIAWRREAERPWETAARLPRKYGVAVLPAVQRPLPREAFDETWDNR